MKRGVKQKLRDYFIILNVVCGCIIFTIYNGNSLNFGNNNVASSPKFGDDIHLFDKKDLNLKKILFWTSYFGDYNFAALLIDQETFRNCPVECQLTFNKSLFGLSDGVIFHARDINSNSENMIPDYHPPSQIWIFLNQESPKHTHLDLKNYANVFNWTMTYRRDSDIYHPYGRFVRIEEPISKTSTLKADKGNILLARELSGNNSHRNDNDLISYNKSHSKRRRKIVDKSSSPSASASTSTSTNQSRLIYKPKLVAWVASHCSTFSNREGFVYALEQYVPVDKYGKCGDLVCPGNSSLDCFPFLSKIYKFYLSFENSLCTDYVTEKFYHILRYDIVPVVYGAADYSQIAPYGSFINARDFPSEKELAEYLLYLDSHHEEYLKYFSWKSNYRVENSNGWCSLCVKINNFSARKRKTNSIDNINTKWYSDLHGWWNNVPISSGANSENIFTTSTSTSATFENLRQSPLVLTSFSQSPTKYNQYQYSSTSNSLKAFGIHLADNEPEQSTCFIAPTFPTESLFSRVLRYIMVN